MIGRTLLLLLFTIYVKVIQTGNDTAPPSRHSDKYPGARNLEAKGKVVFLFVPWEEKFGFVVRPFVIELFPLEDHAKFILVASDDRGPEVDLKQDIEKVESRSDSHFHFLILSNG